VGLGWLCFVLTMATDQRQARGRFWCSKGVTGLGFVGDELDVRRKESSTHTLLVLLLLIEDSCLVQKGGNLGSVTIRKPKADLGWSPVGS
jgi:hypothetical protein